MSLIRTVDGAGTERSLLGETGGRGVLVYRHARAPRRRFLAVALGVIAVLLVCAGVTGFLAYHRLDGNIRSLDVTAGLGDDRPTAEPPAGGGDGPLNILVIGSDTRAGENGFIGGGREDAGRSDTTLLLHVAADRQSALGVSIPRDSMVEMPDCATAAGGTEPGGLRQFNDAFTIGGAACTQRTVEQLTRVRIDHFVVVDFAGFKDMVDALGSVEVCLPKAVNDPKAALDLPAGRSRVDGETALAYVRTRHGLGDGGDLGRVERQQAFLSSVLQEATSAGTLANPAKLYAFLDRATQAITVDPGLASLTSLASLARDVQQIGLDRIRFLTVPTQQYEPDHNRLEWAPAADLVWRAVRQDRPLTTTPLPSTPSPSVSPSASAAPTPSATTSTPVEAPGVRTRTADENICD